MRIVIEIESNAVFEVKYTASDRADQFLSLRIVFSKDLVVEFGPQVCKTLANSPNGAEGNREKTETVSEACQDLSDQISSTVTVCMFNGTMTRREEYRIDGHVQHSCRDESTKLPHEEKADSRLKSEPGLAIYAGSDYQTSGPAVDILLVRQPVKCVREECKKGVAKSGAHSGQQSLDIELIRLENRPNSGG
ncbi:unnamed protein product [Protopolystoma xenopodis]|uniref:Uncharacterized protein n=1 Tax=Protopolystoma xenopodis TaxID=117903 RepID=A0A448WDT1_9PLAT|nr:unnamed protein product [Protopolystoma xenopodis]